MKKWIVILSMYTVSLGSWVFGSAPALKKNRPMCSIMVKSRPEKMDVRSPRINETKKKIEAIELEIADLSTKKQWNASNNDWVLFKYFDTQNKAISRFEEKLSPISKQIIALQKLEVSPKQLRSLLPRESAAERKQRENIQKLQDDLNNYVTNFKYKNPKYGWQKISERNALFHKLSLLKRELSELEEMYQIPIATPEGEE